MLIGFGRDWWCRVRAKELVMVDGQQSIENILG